MPQERMPQARRCNPHCKRKQTGNGPDQAQSSGENGVPLSFPGTYTRREREHGADHRPGKHIHNASNESYCCIDAGVGGVKEVLDQNDVKVVDDDLANEKRCSLYTLAETSAERGTRLSPHVLLARNADNVSNGH